MRRLRPKISADVCSGISFNNDFSNGWRSKDPLSISITGIGHILSILPLFGISELPPVFVKRGSYSGYHDTALFSSVCNGISVNGCYSWGAPFRFNYDILTTDSLLNINEYGVSLYGPRDVKDKSGLFIRPPLLKQISSTDFTPSNAVNYFLDSHLKSHRTDLDCLNHSLSITSSCLSASLI